MITSAQNSKIKLARALQGRAKERREAGAFLVEGVRLVEEAVKSSWPIRFVLFDESLSERGRSHIESLKSQGVDVEEISTGIMQSLAETETPQGILAVLNDYQLPIPGSLNFILVPDQVRDPGNLGTLLRTAAAAGVQAVLIPPETTDVFASKVLRSGMGAHFRLPIQTMDWNDIEKLTKGLQVFLADMDGQPCWEADLRQPLALVIGSEADGASESARKLAAGSLSIPMAMDVESLNAAVAGSVLMLEVVRQRLQLETSKR